MYALLGRTQDFREGDKGTFRDTGRQEQSPVESSEDRPLPSGKCQLIFHFFFRISEVRPNPPKGCDSLPRSDPALSEGQ